MDINSLMGAQLSSLRQTVNLSLLNMTKNTKVAGATMMLQDFSQNQAQIQSAAQASHPTLGKSLDIKV